VRNVAGTATGLERPIEQALADDRSGAICHHA